MKVRTVITALLATALLLVAGTSHARWLNVNNGRFQTMDSFEGVPTEPQTLHKYTYAHNDPVNLVDPSGHLSDGTTIGQAVNASLYTGLNTIEAIAVNEFRRRALQTLTFKVGAYAIVGTTAATTVGGVAVLVSANGGNAPVTINSVVQMEISSSTDDRVVNEAIEMAIEEAKRQRNKIRFFHYTPRTQPELANGLFAGSYGALRGNIYYYEARQKLGVPDPKFVYPVDVDPLVTPILPEGLTGGGGFGIGGEPQVLFPAGTPPGSVLPGRETYR
jgi:hypothetical protein